MLKSPECFSIHHSWSIDGFIPFKGYKNKVKCKQPRLEFQLASQCPVSTTITFTLWTSPKIMYNRENQEKKINLSWKNSTSSNWNSYKTAWIWVHNGNCKSIFHTQYRDKNEDKSIFTSVNVENMDSFRGISSLWQSFFFS